MREGDCDQPVRTCISCRQRSNKSDLIRLVLKAGEVVVDEEHHLPARGAYVHGDVACISRLRELHRWERAFRCEKESLDQKGLFALIEGLRIKHGGVQEKFEVKTSRGNKIRL